MRLKYDFEVMELDGQFIAVPSDGLGNGFNGSLRLNKAATVVFEQLKDESTEDELLATLEDRYDAPRDVLLADLRRLLDTLDQKGLLER